MKTCELRDFDREFPETFNWQLINKLSLSDLATDISMMIRKDLLNKQRNLVPGLRTVLELIAERTEVTD